MTRDEFKKVLDKKNYKWREEGEWIIVEEPDYLNLHLKSIPDNVQFNNGNWVDLGPLKSIPDNIQFNNGTYVHLNSLESIVNNVQFNNGGDVYLRSLKSIHINVDIEEMFSKCGDVKINEKWNNIPFPDSTWKKVDGKVKMYESWVKNNY